MANQNPEPSYNQYKVRKLTWNHVGTVFGISLPREIAKELEGVKFDVSTIQSGSEYKIILTSGLDLVQLKKDIGKYKFDDFK